MQGPPRKGTRAITPPDETASSGYLPAWMEKACAFLQRPPVSIFLALTLVTLAIFSLIAPMQTWPAMDESNYILQSWQIAHGQLPYRDFYEFVTPGGQLLGALLIRLQGFSILGLRMLVLCGWLLTLLLVQDMTRQRLSPAWQALLLAFLWLTESRYPIYQHHFWSGLTALLAIYYAWKALGRMYADQSSRHGGKEGALFLAASGLFTALTFWITQSLGVLIAGSLGLFGLLSALLHEREERGVSFAQTPAKAVLKRWFSTWGRFWLSPTLGVHAACIVALFALGIADDFRRDSISWLIGGHYQRTTLIGYFTTFHKEFMETLRPFLDQVPMPYLLLFILRLPIALHLALIGILPLIGILGTAFTLPNRFLYRMLRQDDEERLLLLLASIGLVLSTFNYSASMHIVSNGAIPFMLGWRVLCDRLSSRPAASAELRVITTALLLCLLLGAAVGSWLQLMGGTWLPRFRGMMTPLLYTDSQTNASQLLTVVNLLEEAKAHGRAVFIFCETPALYLPGQYRNATRFTLILPYYTSAAQMREIMADLERNQPLYIVDDNIRFHLAEDPRFAAYPPERLAMPRMAGYLRQHYRLKAIAGRYHVYQRLPLVTQ